MEIKITKELLELNRLVQEHDNYESWMKFIECEPIMNSWKIRIETNVPDDTSLTKEQIRAVYIETAQKVFPEMPDQVIPGF